MNRLPQILLLFLLSCAVCAQEKVAMSAVPEQFSRLDSDYLKFRAGFEELNDLQTGDIPDNDALTIPSALPDWFGCNSGLNSYPIIGISDPNSSAEAGRIQAILRAEVLMCLMNESIVSNLTDHYTSEFVPPGENAYGAKYTEYYHIGLHAVLDTSSYKILDEYRTDFGESLILLVCKPDLPASTLNGKEINARFEVLINEFEKENTYELNSLYHLEAQSQLGEEIHKLDYTSRGINQFFDFSSKIDSQTFPSSDKALKYKSTVNTAGTQSGIRLNFGLWHAYQTSILNALFEMIKKSSAEVSTLSDNYYRKMQNLDREIILVKTSFRPTCPVISDNRLSATLKDLKIQKP